MAVPDPNTFALDETTRPWVDHGNGSATQLLSVSAATGTWVMRKRFQPGYRLAPHRHTGEVHAFTTTGRWHYLEYDFISGPGSYLHESAGSTHTLEALADNEGVTEVAFVIEGALIEYDESGQISAVRDGLTTLDAYVERCRAAGLQPPCDILR